MSGPLPVFDSNPWLSLTGGAGWQQVDLSSNYILRSVNHWGNLWTLLKGT
jgi:hypothetical protein